MNNEPCGPLLVPRKPSVCSLLPPPLFLPLKLLLMLLELTSLAGARMLSGGGGGGTDDGTGRSAASGRDFDPGEAMPAPPEDSAGKA